MHNNPLAIGAEYVIIMKRHFRLEKGILRKNRKERLDFKTIHHRCVVNKKNHRKSSQKQKLFIPVLIQQHVSA